MIANGENYHTIWVKEDDQKTIQIIDQRYIPFEFIVRDLKTLDDCYIAIKDMWVRGAPLIGVTAAYGMYLAALQYETDEHFDEKLLDAAEKLLSSRPTAVNLAFAVNKMVKEIFSECMANRVKKALFSANKIKDFELENSRQIGINGVSLIEEISKKKKGETVNILTHCNAGWLACVDYGTATAPIYEAQKRGINIHVWVDETRPRNQGARLTAWEMEQQGIPYTVIADNTGGLLMQRGMVDMVVVGSDRTSLNGDVANKIGTYLKALAAHDNSIPFYVALPTSTIDAKITDGVKKIPIEERNQDEVKYIEGFVDGKIKNALVMPEKGNALNYGFDITPAKYVTKLITEKGVCSSDIESIQNVLKDE